LTSGGATGGGSSSRGSVTPTPSVGKMDKAQNVVKNIEKLQGVAATTTPFAYLE
jgi:glutamine synthetase type III